jgi:hypothetical protein
MNESKKGGYAMLTGFILVLLAGLLTAGFGIEYKAGYKIIDTTTGSSIQYVFNTLTLLESIAIGTPLFVGGLWGIIVVVLAFRTQGREDRDG